MFCKPFGFKQISQVLSVKFSVTVNGNDFIVGDPDSVTVEKHCVCETTI